mmetsp:Transcript_23336/g.31944  ORF Transcript_23336/g.31944 Transcript_23336/m.31944 type:complete len:315 (-) Transcript_23336:46-990(-)
MFQSSLLAEMCLGYSFTGAHYKSIQMLTIMEKRNLTIDLDMSKKIMKSFMDTAKTDLVRKAFSLLLSLGGLYDQDSLQMITNTFARNVNFITGAVSMATLPAATLSEVAFIGRSNVGKSSLINMLTNRKKLAYTSKTPGKTSEFNYFEIQSVVGVDKAKSSFYIVDLPGVGYAQASRDLRSSWTNLLTAFAHQRSTLRVLFHLVDSRHGLMEADYECLDLVATLPSHVTYAIVFTKVDKTSGGGGDSGEGSKHHLRAAGLVMNNGMVDRVYREIAKRTTRVVPLFFTSSESRQGGVDMWDFILTATTAKAYEKE